MASGFFVLDSKGKPLIQRVYRGDCSASLVSDAFTAKVLDEDPSLVSPIFTFPDPAASTIAACRSAGAEGMSPSHSSSATRPPAPSGGTVTFLWLQRDLVYLVLMTRLNASAAMLTVFLDHIAALLSEKFGCLTDECIRTNFVSIYEILDEAMDFGLPIVTRRDLIEPFLTQAPVTFSSAIASTIIAFSAATGAGSGSSTSGSVSGNSSAAAGGSSVTSLAGRLAGGMLTSDDISKLPSVLPGGGGGTQWRQPGIKHRKNEVFLDVCESVHMLLAPTGAVLSAEVTGALQMQTRLSGMPELYLGLNDRVQFDFLNNETHSPSGAAAADARSPPTPATGTAGASSSRVVALEGATFHPCVQRMGRVGGDKTVIFVPPDGAFQLMTYRVALSRPRPPLLVTTTLERHGATRVTIHVRVRAAFKARSSSATGVVLRIPVPSDITAPQAKPTGGSSKYVPENDEVVWKMRTLPAGTEHSIAITFGLPTIRTSADAAVAAASGVNSLGSIGKRAVAVTFEIPYFTVSGFQVRFLKVVERQLQYQALPWVRYITKAGRYHARLAESLL
eukprot:TRINITY_DN50333_c0_g1_i1.p1 TRINITY_DN50333_c0_g1~~TRINITY_DN50333_c0_g1_i1.p1  ORF type:complete len:562 (-),score=36.50 TRINITY_DN50333_c0_g1_i1:294-1979(-)